MFLRASAALCAVAVVLTASVARADDTPPAEVAGVTWAPGPIGGARAVESERAAGDLDTYGEIIDKDRDQAPHSRELMIILGTTTVGVGAAASTVAFKNDSPALGVSFAGLGLWGGALAVGSIIAPTQRALREELERARENPDPEAGAREIEEAFARAAAREKTVRKATAIASLGGAAVAFGGAVVVGVQADKEDREAVSTLIGIGALAGAVAISDLIRPWEIEHRYLRARAAADVRVSAAPLPGGGTIQLVGTF